MSNAKVIQSALAVGLVVALGQTMAQPASRPATGPEATGTRPVAGSRFAPFVFVHAGDPEMGSPDLPGTKDRFALLARRAGAVGANMVYIAGDILHDYDAEHLAALDETLKAFAMPVKAVPGNHDHLDEYRKRFGPEDSVFTLNNCDFVGLDSNDLSPARRVWLEAALKAAVAAGRTHIFVVMHHPPENDLDLDALLRKYGVAAVFSGHLHKTGQSDHKGFTVYWVSGTAKVRDDNGLRYNVVKVYQDRVEVKHIPLDSEVGAATTPAK